MHRRGKTLTFILIIIIVIQLIQPTRNISRNSESHDIGRVYTVPANVNRILVEKCYDCHSNNTRYPWYFNVQPIGWWLAAHVHDGKEHLNFSEFEKYDAEERADQFEEIVEVVEERSMPIKTYVWLHPDAELTDDDESTLRAWIQGIRNPQ